jgi:hypothetical protein
MTLEYVNQLTCQLENKIAVVQILPVLDTSPKIVYYDNCELTLKAACRRQCTGVPEPNPTKLQQLRTYVNGVIVPELNDIFANFHYSVEVWYNHLTAIQQDEIDAIDDDSLFVRHCSIFCKGEKQQDAVDPPKNRCISALNANHKKVMGPVVYAAEQYIKQFKGYCGGCNWDDLGDIYKSWDLKDYKIIQSDISGMDRSVKMELKDIIFHTLYNILTPFIHHVPNEIWLLHAFPIRTNMLSKMFDKNELIDFGSATIEGTVFSGSCDTTFMNTLTTVILQRFVMEVEMGLDTGDYDLLGKGDDSAVGITKNINNADIIAAYARCYYFTPDLTNNLVNQYRQHGFGMTLKFLQISEHLDDIDFCSTNCFYCTTCNKYRVTRRLDRFIELTPWSSVVIPMTNKHRLAYKQNLYTANLAWMRGLPIFSQLNDYLKTDVVCNYSLAGRQRKQLRVCPFDEEWARVLFVNKHSDNVITKFGKNDYYSMITQVGSILSCCAKDYYKWLEDKYGLPSFMVDIICKQISDTSDSRYNCPLLTDAIQHYGEYKKSTYFTR